jgi:hypothetical protein
MTILLLVFWGRKPRTKLRTVLRACSETSSGLPFLGVIAVVVTTLVATASLTSFFFTGIGVERGLDLGLAFDEV